MSRVLIIALPLLLAACGPEEEIEDDDGDEEIEPTDDYGCDEVELDPLGPEDPVVGDSWTVWLRCDGATLTGPSVLRFDPPDFATLDGNVATFVYAGSATMTMQVGGEQASMDVDVSEAR